MSDNKLKNLIEKLKKKLSNFYLNNLDKQSILDFIYLYNLLKHKEFLDEILNDLNKVDTNMPNYELVLKLENILQKLEKKKYDSKTENHELKSYSYTDRHEIYFLKEIDINFLVNYIKNDLNFKINKSILNPLELYIKKNSKYQLVLVNSFEKWIQLGEFSEDNLDTILNEFLIASNLLEYDFSVIKLRLNI